MLIDFKGVHSQYLQPVITDRKVFYKPANPENPKLGYFPASHQIFSNNALQVALYIYNPGASSDSECSSVSHCLYLNFSNKNGGQYLLNNDADRITFQLDVGVAKDLYQFASGHSSSFEYRAVRQGRAPRVLKGYVEQTGKSSVPVLEAVTVNDAGTNIIRVQLSGAAEVSLATYSLGYARLLYPSITDMALLALLSTSRQQPTHHSGTSHSPIDDTLASGYAQPTQEHQIRACADIATPAEQSPRHKKMARVIWAIGNQKWPNMRLDSLQAIQAEPEARLQVLIDQANSGDFREWDSYL